MNALLTSGLAVLRAHPWLLAGIAGMALGAALSGGVLRLYYHARIAQMETRAANVGRRQAEAEAAALADILTRLEAAQKRGDELTRQLAAAQTARQRIAEEKDHEIARLATGRPCLGAGLVRLLNDRNQESGIKGRLPTPTGLVADADSAAAPDTAYASDADIALWARNARDEHDACRERIAALRNWFAD
ncbi:MAG: hypothetical protein LBJ59_09085 [Zoogloeaceae bacterium]|jgi:hypothetical protein|nr:hypothetical protein [Zoogloeaceae bacterium]